MDCEPIDAPLSGKPLDELTDEELLARCGKHAPDGADRTAACDVLVRRYTPLVRACVRPYRDSPESFDDLMQVGFIGLLKAIRNFDPEFGNGLRSYAAPCITGEVKRHFRDKRWQVRVTRPVQELLLELRGVTEDLTTELGRHPLEEELARRLGVSRDELREARQAGQAFTALSLNAPVGEAEDATEFGELLGREDGGIDHAVDMEAVERHWDELPHREQQILIFRFYGNQTQEEIAARLGLSQMHVSRLQARALTRLRNRLLSTGDAAADQRQAS